MLRSIPLFMVFMSSIVYKLLLVVLVCMQIHHFEIRK